MWEFFALASGLISVAFASILFFYVDRHNSGDEKIREISDAIRLGSRAYLRRQFLTLMAFTAAVAVLLILSMGVYVAFAFIAGSLFSALAGVFGMEVATRANAKSAWGSRESRGKAFTIAFFGGSVMGLLVVGTALVGIGIFYIIFKNLDIVLGFSLGASMTSLFAKAGGGIYTKTADIGADLVGKVELGIPEDDPRNPAVIADNVGDNVGDVAGMGADLFDSYVASIVAAMIVGFETMRQYQGGIYVVVPLILASIGIFSSIIGMVFVKLKAGSKPGVALNMGTFSTCAIFIVLLYLVVWFLNLSPAVFWATALGLASGAVMGVTTDVFTSVDKGSVRRTANSARTGAAINILSGFSYGIVSIMPPVISISAATLLSWYVASLFGIKEIYGVAVAAVGMLSIVGMIVSADAYGPIVDNAKGIAEQANMGEGNIEILDSLDAAGNTAKAVTKGFAIGAAALTVLALFHAYSELVDLETLDLMEPHVLAGLFIGASIPPLLSALLILGVQKNAFLMVEEVRRQFKEIPGLMEGRAKPDYARCVDISAKGALKELILPGVVSLASPVAVGLFLGKGALGGFLAGSIVTGIIFALFMANAGATWDNAKKLIESGEFGGPGSEAHKAAIVGDTVGDPFKDTAGPSLNTLITVMSLMASLFGPLIVKFALI
jgi:K(+)-stimulated pyrophosphate-energized sodium pump